MRFPGFEGEWKKKKLSEISKLITKGTTPNKFVDQGIKFIKIECFAGDNIDEKKCLFIDEKTHTKELKRSILEENDLLFAIAGATIGKVNIVANEILPANTNQALAIIRLKEEENSSFIYQILKSEIMKKYIKDTISVGAQPNLNLEQINNFSSFQPDLLEQQKIASFLSIIDERIQTQNKIIESLETLIKGLSEKLFNQKLRFKYENGDDFSDWEIKRLGEVFSFKITNSYSREKLNYEEGHVKNIHYGDIHTQYRTLFIAQKENAPYINLDVNISKIEEENYCKKGDLIIADASEDLKDVGKSIEVVSLNEKILAGLHTILARPMADIFSIGFCGYLFKSEKIRLQIQKEAQGSKVLSISANRLSNVVLCVPCLLEQTQIVNFFSDIDEKIETERNILKKYEFQKQYFLRNLFI